MVFSSIVFIFRFLPIAFGIYFITPLRYKNLVLTLLSLIFYSWGEGKYFLIMIASIVVDYTAGRFIGRYRNNKKVSAMILGLSVCFNLGMLFFFKYFNFFIDNVNTLWGLGLDQVEITLPLGISFYTFQTMSYSIDVFRGNVEPEKNIITFSTFVTLFPQLIAGPIVRYSDIALELKKRYVSKDSIEKGIEKFILGLGQKVLIANNIGMLWNDIETMGFEKISTPLAWMGLAAFGLQIYFDFSGYSLMAIGLGEMLGFSFPQNFNYPYISRSISEFWRRWHMTLGSWFREYLYIPLGGNRKGFLRTIINLFLVWFLTGLWHGASYNFILWGLLFFILISVEKAGLSKILDKHKKFSHIYTLFFLMVGWGLFAITDFSLMSKYFEGLFKFRYESEYLYYLRNYAVIFIIAIVLSTPVIPKLYKKYVKSPAINAAVLMFIFIIAVAYLVDATYNPFLYFRF